MTAQDKVIELAKEAGFDNAAKLDPKTIVLHEQVREMCAEGKCNAYGKNWTCPPACGDLDYCRSVIARYSEGVNSIVTCPVGLTSNGRPYFSAQRVSAISRGTCR